MYQCTLRTWLKHGMDWKELPWKCFFAIETKSLQNIQRFSYSYGVMFRLSTFFAWIPTLLTIFNVLVCLVVCYSLQLYIHVTVLSEWLLRYITVYLQVFSSLKSRVKKLVNEMEWLPYPFSKFSNDCVQHALSHIYGNYTCPVPLQ